jgi:hypothetical protein
MEILHSLSEAGRLVVRGGSTEYTLSKIHLLLNWRGRALAHIVNYTDYQVIMATNRIDILDSALLRPGRIDRKIEFPPPNPEARITILKIHSRKMSLQRGINFRSLAEKMGHCSGAEVRGICTEAGESCLGFFSPCHWLHYPPSSVNGLGHMSPVLDLSTSFPISTSRPSCSPRLTSRNVRSSRKTAVRRSGRL